MPLVQPAVRAAGALREDRHDAARVEHILDRSQTSHTGASAGTVDRGLPDSCQEPGDHSTLEALAHEQFLLGGEGDLRLDQ
ncbi:hypothetical protein SDC9_116435 [bioreactor metagenome]|uniref:Uncharacterized protein n=1 Tax=bioreactor metagenome TaxID=1076179 RepID=A0A645BVM0_9ZZZZ